MRSPPVLDLGLDPSGLRRLRMRDSGSVDLTLVNLDHPAEVRTFEKGRFELYRVGAMTLGRATYEPGWRWSEHVGANTGESACQVEHVGLVLSGAAVARMDDGTEEVMRAGDFFYVPPDMTAGSSAMSRMCRSTSWGARTTPHRGSRPHSPYLPPSGIRRCSRCSLRTGDESASAWSKTNEDNA